MYVCTCVAIWPTCTFTGIEKECRVIKEYYWRPLVKKMFEEKVCTCSLVPSGKPGDEANVLVLHVCVLCMYVCVYVCTYVCVYVCMY